LEGRALPDAAGLKYLPPAAAIRRVARAAVFTFIKL